jgi:hypothetical protein
VEDLGFDRAQTTSDPVLQARLERRTRMLKTHQILGLATAVPLVASLATGEGATLESNSRSRRRLHAGLGVTTGVLYFTTASFAIFAPEGPSEKKSGATKIHRALAFLHFPAMVLTPILGYKAKRQVDRGEEVHGSAKYHQTAAGVAAGSFLAAMLVMTINFGGKK